MSWTGPVTTAPEPAPSRLVVLVEGRSDAAVVAPLLARYASDEVDVLVLDGITNIERQLSLLSADAWPSVCGLCDAGEVGFVERALARRGVEVRDRDDLARHGFFVCDRDLEDELIAALGADEVLDALAGLGELGRFRTFQNQPEWRDRSVEDQLHRFAGSGSGRKLRLAETLAARLTPATTPKPLAELVAHIDRVLG
jgi:hypothetical protein